jgi:hypothetical protein
MRSDKMGDRELTSQEIVSGARSDRARRINDPSCLDHLSGIYKDDTIPRPRDAKHHSDGLLTNCLRRPAVADDVRLTLHKPLRSGHSKTDVMGPAGDVHRKFTRCSVRIHAILCPDVDIGPPSSSEGIGADF